MPGINETGHETADHGKTSRPGASPATMDRNGAGALSADAFAFEAKASAERAGCRFLFELPALLLDKGAEKAAAILCPRQDGLHVIFLVYSAEARRITVLESEAAPAQVVDFAWSYAKVLSLISESPSARMQ